MTKDEMYKVYWLAHGAKPIMKKAKREEIEDLGWVSRDQYSDE